MKLMKEWKQSNYMSWYDCGAIYEHLMKNRWDECQKNYDFHPNRKIFTNFANFTNFTKFIKIVPVVMNVLKNLDKLISCHVQRSDLFSRITSTLWTFTSQNLS